jgi:hypothetical protein
MLGHGSHLVDTARYLGGDITRVSARLVERGGTLCWFVGCDFAGGAVGHLDLTLTVRMDLHEGFQAYGDQGSVIGRTFLPWYLRTSQVEAFSARDGQYRRPLGPDGHFWRRQAEGFAAAVLDGAPQRGATVDDGPGGPAGHRRHRTLRGYRRPGGRRPHARRRLMRLGIFARTFARGTLEAALDAVVDHGLDAVQFNLALAGGPPLPASIAPATAASIRRGARRPGTRDERGLRHLQHGPPRPRRAVGRRPAAG